MQESPYSPNDTKPTPRRKRAALRASLMIVIAGLVLLLVLLLLSSLVKPAAPEAKIPPDQNVIEPTQTSEAPQPAVVPADGSPEDGNANPAIAPEETGNQFIDASGSSSGLFGQLSQEVLSDFQTCADELEYTARIDDIWDIWELIFYTIYADQDNASTTPPACQQLASNFASNGRGEFLTALGGDWWSRGSIPTSGTSTCSTAEECILAQEAEELLALEGNTSLVACLQGLLPPGLCAETTADYAQACAERFDWTGLPEELQTVVQEEYFNNLGDVPFECVLFAGLPFLNNATITNTIIGIQNGATCAAEDTSCQTIQSPNLELSQAQQCALDTQWSATITNNTEALKLLEYLAASAPWLPPGSMPPSCTQLLLSASPTEAGAAYWELLGKTLSERRIDTLP